MPEDGLNAEDFNLISSAGLNDIPLNELFHNDGLDDYFKLGKNISCTILSNSSTIYVCSDLEVLKQVIEEYGLKVNIENVRKFLQRTIRLVEKIGGTVKQEVSS